MIVTRGYGTNACLVVRGFSLRAIYETLVLFSTIHLEMIKRSYLYLANEIILSSAIGTLKEMRSQIKLPDTLISLIHKWRRFVSIIDIDRELRSRIDTTRDIDSPIEPPEE